MEATRVRSIGWRAWIPSLAALLTAGCSGLGILGPGPPDVTVYDLPKRPQVEATTALGPDGRIIQGVRLYSLTTEDEVEVVAFWSRGGQEAFGAWLREVLARFEANRCALLAVNGEMDERCQAPK